MYHHALTDAQKQVIATIHGLIALHGIPQTALFQVMAGYYRTTAPGDWRAAYDQAETLCARISNSNQGRPLMFHDRSNFLVEWAGVKPTWATLWVNLGGE